MTNTPMIKKDCTQDKKTAPLLLRQVKAILLYICVAPVSHARCPNMSMIEYMFRLEEATDIQKHTACEFLVGSCPK